MLNGHAITTKAGRAKVAEVVEATLPKATVRHAHRLPQSDDPVVQILRYNGNVTPTKGPFASLVTAITFQVSLVGVLGPESDDDFDKLVAAFVGRGYDVEIGGESQVENSVNQFASTLYVTLDAGDVS